MKVAVNGRFLLPRLEGVGHYTYQLIDHLSATHPEDEYHVIVDREIHMPFMDRSNVIRHVLSPQTRHPLLWYYWLEWRLPALLKKIGPDVFFSPDGFLSLRTNCPTLLTIHDLAYLHYPKGTQSSHLTYLRKYMPQFLQHADQVVAVSKYTAEDINQQFSGLSSKVKTVHNGVTDDFHPLDDEDKIACRKYYTNGKPYFIYVGSIHPRKNVVSLIRAFDQYKEQSGDDMCLVLAGRVAWKSDETLKALNQSTYSDYIVQLADIDREIPKLIASAEALCYVSLFEGFGLPVLEAMASGTPVITSEDSAMSEVCGEAAIYVDPASVKSIAEALITVVKEPSRVASIAALGLTRSKEYTWAKAAKKIHDCLKELC